MASIRPGLTSAHRGVAIKSYLPPGLTRRSIRWIPTSGHRTPALTRDARFGIFDCKGPGGRNHSTSAAIAPDKAARQESTTELIRLRLQISIHRLASPADRAIETDLVRAQSAIFSPRRFGLRRRAWARTPPPSTPAGRSSSFGVALMRGGDRGPCLERLAGTIWRLPLPTRASSSDKKRGGGSCSGSFQHHSAGTPVILRQAGAPVSLVACLLFGSSNVRGRQPVPEYRRPRVLLPSFFTAAWAAIAFLRSIQALSIAGQKRGPARI